MTVDPRYPIGKWVRSDSITPADRRNFIQQISEAPSHLRQAVKGLNDKQLETPYRDGGWTVRQVVHHLPDSHMNAYIRLKLALTEDEPTIKPYHENLWAELHDGKTAAVEPSLLLLESLHYRWVNLLRTLKDDDFFKKLNHPEMGKMTLDNLMSLYAWHGRHHVGQISTLREQMQW